MLIISPLPVRSAAISRQHPVIKLLISTFTDHVTAIQACPISRRPAWVGERYVTQSWLLQKCPSLLFPSYINVQCGSWPDICSMFFEKGTFHSNSKGAGNRPARGRATGKLVAAKMLLKIGDGNCGGKGYQASWYNSFDTLGCLIILQILCALHEAFTHLFLPQSCCFPCPVLPTTMCTLRSHTANKGWSADGKTWRRTAGMDHGYLSQWLPSLSEVPFLQLGTSMQRQCSVKDWAMYTPSSCPFLKVFQGLGLAQVLQDNFEHHSGLLPAP